MKTPEELRVLRYKIRMKELENENLKGGQQGAISEVEFRMLLKVIFMLIVCAWSMSIFVMFCAIVFWPELAEVLDQFIVGFGALAAGVFLGRRADDFLDKLFD